MVRSWHVGDKVMMVKIAMFAFKLLDCCHPSHFLSQLPLTKQRDHKCLLQSEIL